MDFIKGPQADSISATELSGSLLLPHPRSRAANEKNIRAFVLGRNPFCGLSFFQRCACDRPNFFRSLEPALFCGRNAEEAQRFPIACARGQPSCLRTEETGNRDRRRERRSNCPRFLARFPSQKKSACRLQNRLRSGSRDNRPQSGGTFFESRNRKARRPADRARCRCTFLNRGSKY